MKYNFVRIFKSVDRGRFLEWERSKIMAKTSIFKRGLAVVLSVLLMMGLMVPLSGTVLAADMSPRVAQPSEGMTSSDKIVYTANAVEFGADPSGNNNSTDAIQNALWDAYNQRGGIVFLPAGRYKVEGTLTVPSGVSLRGEWMNPDEGGLGKGTILMAYAGKGSEDLANSFLNVRSGACLRDISIWYPEQSPTNVSVYPPTIRGEGHSDVINVTLYNSYYGFYNNSCSSMLIRGLYGTVLYRGVHGAYAYDIPRIERVFFDTKYWANSGLAGAPSGDALNALNTYAENNLVAIQAGEQDWGYWFDINVNHAKWALYLTAVIDDPGNKVVPGNIAAGKVITRNTKVGVYMENVGYPGFQLTHSDIEATEYGMYYTPKPDYDALYGSMTNPDGGAVEVRYYENATIVISASAFKGGKAGFWSDKAGGYNINFNDCTFENWSQYAVRMHDGSLTLSNSTFKDNKTALQFTADVDQAVMLGNSFASSNVLTGNGWSNTDSRLVRNDASTDIPHTPDYDYDYVSDTKPAGDAIFDVTNYGAVKSNNTHNPPSQDSTVAIQMALNAAKAAGGGTVYVPAGVYRMNGGVTVPTGVELRGSFESAHYGNSTNRGTQLYAYGDKDRVNGTPLITLEKGAGVKGFSVFYPEQGYTDTPTEESDRVHAYPPTVRANQDTWIQNMAITACYTAVDAMSNNCDNIIITDVTGAALYASLELGHGTNGGYVQNLHFNYSGWVQQGGYPNQPTGDDQDTSTKNGLMIEYATRVVKGIILGDAKNVNFFSCFNILVAEQIVLEKDIYTGGDFEGVMWGVAFDAAMNGVVGRNGSDADLAIIASMGVFNRQNGGYNVVTKPGFTGTVSLYNADAWDYRSKLVHVEGGTVNLVQFFSWCVHNGICKKGGTLNVLASTMVSNNGDNSGTTPDYTYEDGAMGKVVGNLDCVKKLNIITQNGSMVEKHDNAIEREGSTNEAAETLVFSGFNSQDKSITNTDSEKTILDTGWITADGYRANTGANMSGSSPSKLELQATITLTNPTGQPVEQVFRSTRLFVRSVNNGNTEYKRYWDYNGLKLKAGENKIKLTLDTGRPDGNNDLDFGSINRIRFYIDSVNNYTGTFTMQVRDVQIVDLSGGTETDVACRIKLGDQLAAQLTGDALNAYTEASVAAYNALFTAAREVYQNPSATGDTLLEQVLALNNAADLLVKREPVASAAVREELRQALNAIRSTSSLVGYTSASVAAYKAFYTAARKVYDDVFATDAQLQEQLNTLKTAESVLEEYKAEEIPLLDGSTTSGVAHYMNVVKEYPTPIDLAQYGERASTDIRIKIRVNKDDASFPEAVKQFDASRWIGYVRNGGLGLWAGGMTNDFRHWVHNDLDCAAEGKPLVELTTTGLNVEFTLPVPAAVISAGRIDKFELYLYNDLHNFMREQGDPDNRDNYTEQNTGSSGLSITIDEAVIVLGAGKTANKAALELAIAEAEKVTDLSVYTANTAKIFTDALAEAREIYASHDASQGQVDAAEEILVNAYYGLTRKADKTALIKALEEAESFDLSAYAAGSHAAYLQAVEAAKPLLEDPEADQGTVDRAINAINKAKEKLVDLTPLKELVKEVSAISVSDYTETSVNVLKAAVSKANSVINNDNATQEDVAGALQTLTTAKDGLVNVAELAALVDQASKLVKSNYTTTSYNAVKALYSSSKQTAEDPSATKKEVEDATKALREALDGLVDIVELKAAVETAKNMSTSHYTADTAAVLKAAYKVASGVLSNTAATKEEVNAATADLTGALEGLVSVKGLKDAIAEAEALDTTGHQPATVEAFEKALADAKTVAAKADATKEEVEKAQADLAAAKEALTKVEVLKGDINGNGEVTAEDALLALQIATGKTEATPAQQAAGDVDGQDGVTASDALLILQYATKKIGKL